MKTAAALFLVLSVSSARAGTGGTALPFLKMDQGARAAALGGAYTASGDDAWAVFYNPAGTALSAKSEIALGHNEWFEGIRNETLAYVRPLDSGAALFGGLNALLSGGMDKYDASGLKTGSFSSLEGALSFGASAPLGNGCYGGAAVKGLYQKASGESALAWAGDAGLLKIYGDWRFGASVLNLGSGMKLGSVSFPLPLTLRAGTAWNFRDRLRVSADGIKAGESPSALALGAEGEFPAGAGGSFFARAGYRTGRSRYAGSGLSAGVGLKNGDLRVDYAFTPYGELGDSHRITISVSFGGERPSPAGRRARSGPRRKAGKAAPVNRGAKKKKGKADESAVYFIW
jgi:hypothetical protein